MRDYCLNGKELSKFRDKIADKKTRDTRLLVSMWNFLELTSFFGTLYSELIGA